MNFNLARALVHNILKNATRIDGWSLQGFGMLRLYLSRTMRLHVWSPADAVPNVTTIHTHPWDFTSYVISGQMIDRQYGEVLFQPTDLYKQAWPYYTRSKIVCGPGGGLCPKIENRDLYLKGYCSITVKQGDQYGMRYDMPHESTPEPGTVTIIERHFREDTEHAYVYYPRGTAWISAEPRPATTDEVSRITKLALATWKD